MKEKLFSRFSTPLEDYSKELKKVKTFEDLMQMKEKYFLILDDAEEIYNSITPDNFVDFIQGLPNAMNIKATEIDGVWVRKFGAIVLPRLFLQIIQYPDGGMGTGFVMHRLIDEGLAEVKDGRFRLL